MTNRLTLLISTLLIASMVGFVIYTHTQGMQRASFENRIDTLEQIMRDKTRPCIHINRATVYTSKGEIVVEEKKPKRWGE